MMGMIVWLALGLASLAAEAGAAKPNKTSVVPIQLAPQTFERAKLAFDGLASSEPATTLWDVGGVFGQSRRLADEEERFSLVLRAGRDETLDVLKLDYPSVRIGEPAPVKVCGRPGLLVSFPQAEQHIACVKVAKGHGRNHPQYVPPSRVWALGFKHAGLGVVMRVEIWAAKPDDYKPVVDRILASIRCR